MLGADGQIPKLIGPLLLNGYLSRDLSFLSFEYGTHNALYQANSVNQSVSTSDWLDRQGIESESKK